MGLQWRCGQFKSLATQLDGVEHLIARRLHDMTPLLGMLETRSRDFR